jgi:hypothetical protein
MDITLPTVPLHNNIKPWSTFFVYRLLQQPLASQLLPSGGCCPRFPHTQMTGSLQPEARFLQQVRPCNHARYINPGRLAAAHSPEATSRSGCPALLLRQYHRQCVLLRIMYHAMENGGDGGHQVVFQIDMHRGHERTTWKGER